MIIDYDLWWERHAVCVDKIQRLCEISTSKDAKKRAIKCNSNLCVIKNAIQDIQSFFDRNNQSTAELCFLIRNIDVIVTGIIDINNDFLGIGGKAEKRIERCFTDKSVILKFRTLRSLILAHPVDTIYNNDKGESETVYLEDVRPFNPVIDGFLIKEACDYVKRMCTPESNRSYFEPLSIDKDIIPVINTIIDTVAILTNNIEKQIVVLESDYAKQELDLDMSSMEKYIISLDKELEKRYPSAVENVEYENGARVHYSIINQCLMFYTAHFSKETQEKYDIFLKYIENELHKIENDLQRMQFNEDNYFKLLYNPEFAPHLSYEHEKMEYLIDSNEKSYTEEFIDNDTKSNALWGIRCFRLLIPYIREYIPVDVSVTDKELYCQYVAAQYLSNINTTKIGCDKNVDI